MTTQIRLINNMLATTGTARLASSDTSHPNYITANAVLTDILEEFSTMELWFNTSIRTLTPNTEGRIPVPNDTISCDPVNGSQRYSVRGQYLFDNTLFTDQIPTAVKCVIVRAVPADELPRVAFQYVNAMCRYRYYLDADGGARKMAGYEKAVDKAYTALVANNMKLMDENYFNSAAARAFHTRRQGRGGYGLTRGNAEINLLGASTE